MPLFMACHSGRLFCPVCGMYRVNLQACHSSERNLNWINFCVFSFAAKPTRSEPNLESILIVFDQSNCLSSTFNLIYLFRCTLYWITFCIELMDDFRWGRKPEPMNAVGVSVCMCVCVPPQVATYPCLLYFWKCGCSCRDDSGNELSSGRRRRKSPGDSSRLREIVGNLPG